MSYKTFSFKVSKFNMAEAESFAKSENQFTIRGRGQAKTKRSKFIGKTMDIPSADLEQIQTKLKSNKRKFFELTVTVNGGMSPEQRAKKETHRGRKPNNNAKPIAKSTYLCKVVDGQCFVKAHM